GSSGFVTIDASDQFTPQAMTVQSDGKIIVAGVFHVQGGSSAIETRIYRFNADGSVDKTFASSGIAEFYLGTAHQDEIIDQVAAGRALRGGNIDAIGGAVDFTPGFYDPDSGDSAPAVYGTSQFVIAQLTSKGTPNSAYATAGFARQPYFNGLGGDTFGDSLP